MIFWLIWAALTLWGCTALWVQRRRAWLAGLLVALAAVAWLRVSGGPGWVALPSVAALLLVWFLSLRPRLSRNWAPDVARIVTGDVAGDIVTLQDVRAFRWTSETEATETWTRERVDLRQLRDADIFTSVWGNPKIAHLLVSFGFTTGQRIVFSVEIRREQGEAFSSIGGFFRQFELALIAAPEDDILYLRTNQRGEEVRRYPLHLTPEQLRPIFLAYVALGNRLARRAAFYNTLTANCTTVVWQLLRIGAPGLGWHRSVLLSGLLPGWLHRQGLIADPARQDISIRITPLARAAPEGTAYSQAIRP